MFSTAPGLINSCCVGVMFGSTPATLLHFLSPIHSFVRYSKYHRNVDTPKFTVEIDPTPPPPHYTISSRVFFTPAVTPNPHKPSHPLALFCSGRRSLYLVRASDTVRDRERVCVCARDNLVTVYSKGEERTTTWIALESDSRPCRDLHVNLSRQLLLCSQADQDQIDLLLRTTPFPHSQNRTTLSTILQVRKSSTSQLSPLTLINSKFLEFSSNPHQLQSRERTSFQYPPSIQPSNITINISALLQRQTTLRFKGRSLWSDLIGKGSMRTIDCTTIELMPR